MGNRNETMYMSFALEREESFVKALVILNPNNPADIKKYLKLARRTNKEIPELIYYYTVVSDPEEIFNYQTRKELKRLNNF